MLIKDRIDVDERPKIVEDRSRFGDVEVDLIVGKNHKEFILTINDRASGMLKMRKVASKKSGCGKQRHCGGVARLDALVADNDGR